MENKFIAVYPMSNFGGLGIIDAVPGISVKTAFDFGDGKKNVSVSKIRFNSKGEGYFIKLGKRYYFKNFIKVW